MSWITVRMDLEDNKVKVGWIYLRKFVLDTVRGDQFVYILLEVGYKYSFDYYNISSFFSPCLLLWGSLFYFILSPPFIRTIHLQIRLLVLVPLPSTPSWSLWVVAGRLKTTVQVSLQRLRILLRGNFLARKFFFDINTALIYQSSHFSILTLNLQNLLNLLMSLQTPRASLRRAFFFL